MEDDIREKLIAIIKMLPDSKIPPLIEFMEKLVNDYPEGEGPDQEDQLLM